MASPQIVREHDEDQFPAERNVIEPRGLHLHTYCRSSGEKRRELEGALVRYCKEGDDDRMHAAVFSSGMSAVAAVIQNTLFNYTTSGKTTQPHIVLGDEMYCDIARTITYFSKIFRFTYEFVDVRDTHALIATFKKNHDRMALLMIESCTNPSGQMMDFNHLRALKRIAGKCIICVDNTWLSHVLFQPLRYGADLVLESMTKYVSRSHCIGGMVVGRKRLVRGLTQNWTRIYGQYILPRHCQYFIDGLTDIEGRIAHSAPLTLTVAQYLEAHAAVNRVLYPLLESHPTYEINAQLLSGGLGPSVLMFHIGVHVKCREDVYEFFECSSLRTETSYGSSYTKLDSWAHSGPSDEYDVIDDDNKKDGLWIRLAIGYDDTLQHIIEGLEPLFL